MKVYIENKARKVVKETETTYLIDAGDRTREIPIDTNLLISIIGWVKWGITIVLKAVKLPANITIGDTCYVLAVIWDKANEGRIEVTVGYKNPDNMNGWFLYKKSDDIRDCRKKLETELRNRLIIT